MTDGRIDATTLTVTARKVHAVACQDACADLVELANDDFLNHQLTREAIGSLYDHGANAIRLQANRRRSLLLRR